MEAEYRINEVLRWKKRGTGSTGAQTACPVTAGHTRDGLKKSIKEQNPEKYADTIEKVIKKGSTPAGMHISICVKEILDFLDIKPGMQGLDATLIRRSHDGDVKKLEGQGHMYALDVDPIEIVKTKERLKEPRLRRGDPYDKTDELCRYRQARPEAGLF